METSLTSRPLIVVLSIMLLYQEISSTCCPTRLNLSICLLNFFVQTEKEGAEKVRKVCNTFKIFLFFIWCANKSNDFAARLKSDENKTCFNEAKELIDIDVNSSIQKIN